MIIVSLDLSTYSCIYCTIQELTTASSLCHESFWIVHIVNVEVIDGLMKLDLLLYIIEFTAQQQCHLYDNSSEPIHLMWGKCHIK